MQEKELIEICKSHVEQKFNLPESILWKQRDFQYLSDLIFEKTSVRLSVSTLKRIWKGDDNRTPQMYTLNTLVNLLGYESWNYFRQSYIQVITNGKEKIKDEQTPVKNLKVFTWISISVLLVIGFLMFFHFRTVTTSYKENEIIFKTRKNLTAGVPNTVVFEYDISKIDFDSAFIQQSWDERMRARITKDNHFQTFIYYYPGYHTAKLIINNKIYKQERVNISTEGWEAIIGEHLSGEVPYYIPKGEAINDNKLYVSKKILTKNGIQWKDKNFYVNYFNVGNFDDVYGEDFILETRLKNNLEEGALVCQYCRLTVICENGMISIPLCNPGCTGNINLHISDVFKDGKKNDLAAFGIDLANWRNIRIQTVKKNVTVYVDNKPVYNLLFNKVLGKITGFHYEFYGCGSVDMIKVYNEKNKLVYSDEFL